MRSLSAGPRLGVGSGSRGRARLSSPVARKVLGLGAALLLGANPLLTGFIAHKVDAAGPSFVIRQGQQLTLDGQPFRFTGMNIYAANSDGWCGEVYTANQLRTAFDGIGARNTVLRAWFFQTMAAHKGSDGSWSGVRDWSHFDQTLAVAAEKGVHVVVTLTDQWGECGDGGASGFKAKDWYLGGYKLPDPVLAAKYAQWQSYRDWVTEVVTRYKDNPTILAWQLVNEAEVKDSLTAGCPVGDPNNPMDHGNILRDFARDISDLIRSLDPSHLISLGTIGGGQCGTDAWQYPLIHDLPNIDLCEYHDYSLEAMPGVWYNGLQLRLDQCGGLNKPLFVGETGITPNAIPGATFADRAELFDAKFRAQFAAGVQGELVWAYRRTGSTLTTYDIGDGDPTLLRLQAWSPGCDPNDYRIAYTKEPPRGGAGSPDLYLLDPVTGAQRRVTVDVDHAERHVNWSPEGQHLAYLGGASPGYRPQLKTVDVDGSHVAFLIGSAEAPAFEPAWSPDGSRIAYVLWNPNLPQIGTSRPDGSGATLLGPAPVNQGQDSPSWSPDASRLAYVSSWGGTGSIMTMRSDGTDATTLTTASGIQWVTWSPDGSRLAFTKSELNNGYRRSEIYVMNADGSGQVKLTGSLPNEAYYRFSRPSWVGPDKLLFDSSDINNHYDLYRLNADGTGLTNLTNTPTIDESDPAWRPTRIPPVICGPEPPAPTPPTPPLNVTAVSNGAGSATVSWDLPASDGGAELLDYRISTNGSSVGGVTAGVMSETINGLAGGTYTFTVRTQNIVGPSPESAPSNAVTVAPKVLPPLAPTGLTAGAGDGLAVLSWIAPPVAGSTPGPSAAPGASPGPAGGPVDAYTVTASPGNATSTVDGSQTSTTMTGLSNGTPYTFTVHATNAGGSGPESGSSAPVTPQSGAAPPQTSAATISPSGGTATTDPSGTGPTPSDPITTTVIVPPGTAGGTVTVAETAVTVTPPAGGYQSVGQQIDITSTAATSASNPLTIVFTIDSSAIRNTFALGPADPLPAADQVVITRTETGSPVVVAVCTVSAPPIAPDPCISDRQYINGGDDLRITILTGSASHWNSVVQPIAVTVSDSGYSPPSVTVAQGGIVLWTFAGTKTHSVTENLKLGPAKAPLFTSGVVSSGRYGYVFRAAATYTYGSTVKGDPGSFAGTVGVPIRVSPTNGGTTTSYTVTWSSATLTGYVFDVQYRFMKAGAKTWSPLKAWQTGTSSANAPFSPPSGAGTYAFSARFRNSSTAINALWSPETSIIVR